VIPLWIRRLPHNLSTIRPSFRLYFNRLYWALGVTLYFHANKGNKNYLFHFEEAGLLFYVGPFSLFVGCVDTSEENAWIR